MTAELMSHLPDIDPRGDFTAFSTYVLQKLAEGTSHLCLADEICQFAEKHIGNKIASMMTLAEDGFLSVFAAPHAPPELIQTMNRLKPGPQAGSCGYVVYSNHAVEVADIVGDERWDGLRHVAHEWNLRSCWSYPVRQGSRLLGTFAVTGLTEGPPDERQRFIMEYGAALAGMVLVHRHMEYEEATQRRLYRALFGSLEALIENDDDLEMMGNLCQRLTEKTDFSVVWVGKPNGQGRFVPLAMAGEGTAQIAESPPMLTDHPDAPLIVRAWRRDQQVLSNDLLGDPSLQFWHRLYRKNQWMSLLAIPLHRNGTLWAVLVMVSKRVGAFDPPTIQLCQRVSSLLSQSLDEYDLKHKIKEMQHVESRLARTDSLTGLPNRLAFEEYLPRAMARAERHQRVVAVGLLDLDNFKPVNDRFGHIHGDELLRQLAQRLCQQIRESNFVARLGGDEFVIVFDDLHVGSAMEELQGVLQRVHRAVENPFFLNELQDSPILVEMSMGLALFPGDGQTPEELLRGADFAMYQIKNRKFVRHRWWALTSDSLEVPAPETPFDLFGQEADELLKVLQPHLEPIVSECIRLFNEAMEQDERSTEILCSLTSFEYARLRQFQMKQLYFLLAPATSPQDIIDKARYLGLIHVLVGVTGAMLSRSQSFFRGFLRTHLDLLPLVIRDRYRALRVVDARLQLDMETQLDAMQSVTDSYNACLSLLPDDSLPWVETVQHELDRLAHLPGILCSQLLVPQSQGVFISEFMSGSLAESVEQVFDQSDHRPVLDARQAAGQGLVAQAWHTGQIQCSNAYDHDPRTVVWQEAFYRLGIRSAVAIPVRSVEVEFVLVLLGKYPNQFSSTWMRTFVNSIQNRWDQLVYHRRGEPRSLMDGYQASLYRERLHSGGVELYVQPVVDLRLGRVVKVEALARLQMGDGELVGPGQFLGALKSADLNALFCQGLDQALKFLQNWHRSGMEYSISLNLAPSTLLHPDCVTWVREALQQAGNMDPGRLTLELLESQEMDQQAADAVIHQLEQLGVQLAIDDLGAGFSSLKRLTTLPFDIIKIDQGIVRDILREPIKTLTLIRTIIQIGQDLDREVIVEGVENLGILEAVAVLGARHVQGYGIARPMTASQLPEWVAQEAGSFRWNHPFVIQTWLGALAYHWRYMHNTSQGHWAMPKTEWSDCPLIAFFHARGLSDQPVAQWHREVHQCVDEERRCQASEQLKQWLLMQVR